MGGPTMCASCEQLRIDNAELRAVMRAMAGGLVAAADHQDGSTSTAGAPPVITS